jgi:signal-transduction protein with cAMP-binding, CBS, and nucleotidyltransferase domain
MAKKGVGSLVVMKDDEMQGIITERDYARKVIIKSRSSETTKVATIMTTNVVTATTSQTVNQCMEVMTERGIRHLPVVEDGRVIGMLSMRDLVEAIIADQQEAIEQLESYISG